MSSRDPSHILVAMGKSGRVDGVVLFGMSQYDELLLDGRFAPIQQIAAQSVPIRPTWCYSRTTHQLIGFLLFVHRNTDEFRRRSFDFGSSLRI